MAGARDDKKKTRQHWDSFRGIKALKSSHPDVRRIKRQNDDPSLHGNKVWRSSFALIDYLHHNPIRRGARVIDVGCGWGLTGIWLARTYGADVLAVDADPAVEPYLALQADLNRTEVRFEARRFEDLKRRDLEGVELMVGADICFWEEMVKPLFQLLKRARKAGVTRSIVADPGRPPFWDLAGRAEDKLDGEVLSHRVKRPKPAEKPLLIVRG
jgi:predicted nicotinamide N-methyase